MDDPEKVSSRPALIACVICKLIGSGSIRRPLLTWGVAGQCDITFWLPHVLREDRQLLLLFLQNLPRYMKDQKYEEFPLLPVTHTGDEFATEDGEVEAEGSDPEARHLLATMSTADDKTAEAGIHAASPHDVARRNGANSDVVRKAKAASDVEHKMTLWQGLRLYPKAIGWSFLISLCIAMEGFDLCLLNTFCTWMTSYSMCYPSY